MSRSFTLEYWISESWYVGRLKEVPGVFSQGKSLEELEENIRDAYRMMTDLELDVFRERELIVDAEPVVDGRD